MKYAMWIDGLKGILRIITHRTRFDPWKLITTRYEVLLLSLHAMTLNITHLKEEIITGRLGLKSSQGNRAL
jgi:hypothetical protein